MLHSVPLFLLFFPPRSILDQLWRQQLFHFHSSQSKFEGLITTFNFRTASGQGPPFPPKFYLPIFIVQDKANHFHKKFVRKLCGRFPPSSPISKSEYCELIRGLALINEMSSFLYQRIKSSSNPRSGWIFWSVLILISLAIPVFLGLILVYSGIISTISGSVSTFAFFFLFSMPATILFYMCMYLGIFKLYRTNRFSSNNFEDTFKSKMDAVYKFEGKSEGLQAKLREFAQHTEPQSSLLDDPNPLRFFFESRCVICYMEWGPEIEQFTPEVEGCGHVFCKQCLTQIQHNTRNCPLCRKGFFSIRPAPKSHPVTEC